MSIFEYNGSAVVTMAGKNCVAIAADRRFGIQNQTVATNFQRVFKMQDNIYIGLSGLASDVQTFHAILERKMNLFKLKEEREMTATQFTHLVSHQLYKRRFGPFFVAPVVAGLQDGKAIMCNYDSIGCLSLDEEWTSAGTADEFLMGACESLFKPEMEVEDLFTTISQVLLAAVDRDALSGWGGVVYLVTPEGTTIRTLRGRQD